MQNLWIIESLNASCGFLSKTMFAWGLFHTNWGVSFPIKKRWLPLNDLNFPSRSFVTWRKVNLFSRNEISPFFSFIRAKKKGEKGGFFWGFWDSLFFFMMKKKKKRKWGFFSSWPFFSLERGICESGKRESCLLKNFFFSFSLETKRRSSLSTFQKEKN